MSLQNRVDPWGHLNANNSRGSLLGNRGNLHNEEKEITTQWRHKNWVTCKLNFQGVKREVFSPKKYSELFFLDEATAFSAGHRPCADCCRDRFKEFKSAWCEANLDMTQANQIRITEIDNQLHVERAIREGSKQTYQALFQDIPTGTFIDIEGKSYLLWNKQLHLWSFNGYTKTFMTLEPSAQVKVLTPSSIVKIFHQGFRPEVHESIKN